MSSSPLDLLVVILIGALLLLLSATVMLLQIARKSLLALTQISVAERSNTAKLTAIKAEIEKFRRGR